MKFVKQLIPPESKEPDLFIYISISTILIRWGLTRYWDQQCEGLGWIGIFIELGWDGIGIGLGWVWDKIGIMDRIDFIRWGLTRYWDQQCEGLG